MKLRYLPLFFIILFCSNVCLADEWYVDLNLASKHLNSDEHYNEENYGVGVTYNNGKRDFKVGYFKNSYSKTSMYALIDFTKDFNDTFSYGIAAGFVTGYKGTKGENKLTIMDDVQLMALPNIKMKVDNWRINLGVLPMVAVTLQVEYKL